MRLINPIRRYHWIDWILTLLRTSPRSAAAAFARITACMRPTGLTKVLTVQISYQMC